MRGGQCHGRAQRPLDLIQRLAGKAAHDVDIDAGKACFSRPMHRVSREVGGVHPAQLA